MKRTFLLLILATLITGISAPDTSAQHRKFKCGDFHKQRMENLNLNEGQRTKVDELRNIHQKEMIDLRAELQKAQLDVREIKNKADFKRNDLINAVEKISSIKNKIALKRANHQMDIYELLDENQKEMWRKSGPMRDDKPMMRRDKRMMRTD